MSEYLLTLVPPEPLSVDDAMALVSPYEDEIEGLAVDLRADDSGVHEINLYHDNEEVLDQLAQMVLSPVSAKAVSGAGGGHFTLYRQSFDGVDWVRQVQSHLPPVQVGRFFIYGSHDRERIPPHGIHLEIEAGQAFGTGYHESTRACLLALSEALRFHPPAFSLDFGCGSGVLGLAAARSFRRPVTFIDNDPVALSVCRANARLNAVRWQGLSRVANRPQGRAQGAILRYDFIFANILAEPLIRLAPSLVKALASSGQLVLAGILARRGRAVLSTYRAQGLYPLRVRRDGDWISYTLARRSRSGKSRGRGFCQKAP